jgi:hypothetical protein
VSKRFPAIRGETLPGSVSQNLTQARRLPHGPENCFVVVSSYSAAELQGNSRLVVVRRKFVADFEDENRLVVVCREFAADLEDKNSLVVVRREFVADFEDENRLVVVRREAAMDMLGGLFFHSLAP